MDCEQDVVGGILLIIVNAIDTTRITQIAEDGSSRHNVADRPQHPMNVAGFKITISLPLEIRVLLLNVIACFERESFTCSSHGLHYFDPKVVLLPSGSVTSSLFSRAVMCSPFNLSGFCITAAALGGYERYPKTFVPINARHYSASNLYTLSA